METKSYGGKCFCGAVQIIAQGQPVAMGFCHCNSCRSWAAAPVNAFSLWAPGDIEVVLGQENIGIYHKTENSYRQFCKSCGGHLMTKHPTLNLIDVYAAVIPDLPFEPKLHVHYGEKVLSMKDGLPKFKNVPKEMGGTGETIPE